MQLNWPSLHITQLVPAGFHLCTSSSKGGEPTPEAAITYGQNVELPCAVQVESQQIDNTLDEEVQGVGHLVYFYFPKAT
jgi:hypothetical protein